MGETPRCPDCGNPLAGEGWSEDLCPHCLLQLALEESSGAGVEAETRGPLLWLDASPGCMKNS